MVEARVQEDYEKCILWPITISDYSGTSGYRHSAPPERTPLSIETLLSPKYDRIRITGANNAKGLNMLSPNGYEAWTSEIADTSAKLDAGFTRLMAEQKRTLVVIYYSGHGCLSLDGAFKTCAEVNEYRPSREENKGQLIYYPLQESMEILTKKSNLVVFGIFECCRATIHPAHYSKYYAY